MCKMYVILKDWKAQRGGSLWHFHLLFHVRAQSSLLPENVMCKENLRDSNLSDIALLNTLILGFLPPELWENKYIRLNRNDCMTTCLQS